MTVRDSRRAGLSAAEPTTSNPNLDNADFFFPITAFAFAFARERRPRPGPPGHQSRLIGGFGRFDRDRDCCTFFAPSFFLRRRRPALLSRALRRVGEDRTERDGRRRAKRPRAASKPVRGVAARGRRRDRGRPRREHSRAREGIGGLGNLRHRGLAMRRARARERRRRDLVPDLGRAVHRGLGSTRTTRRPRTTCRAASSPRASTASSRSGI